MGDKTFSELGIGDELQKACHNLRWKEPTAIQVLSIPPALEGRNLVALAETGSGKTGAYALPIIQKLLQNPHPFFALVLAPTRELAAQVQAQFNALGKTIGLSTALLVGGVPITQQSDLMKISPPHVVIATPGRFVDHLKKTKGFDELKFKNLRILVIDEADRMLGVDFESVIEKILCIVPTKRQTFLFSATMTDKVGKLQRASVHDPVRVSTRKSKFQSLTNLRQYVHLVPQCEIDTYLVYLLRVALCPEIQVPGLDLIKLQSTSENEDSDDQSFMSTSVIVFTRTRVASNRLNLLLRQFLRQPVIALNGDMLQAQRLGALHKFKRTQGAVLVATDVASRGLDIPQVGLVVNYDVPLDAKIYMHRVGRTARAGRHGCALTLLTQYSVTFFLKEIESHLISAGGISHERIPALVEPNSSVDKEMEKAIEELNSEVKEASLRANQAVESMRKRVKSKGVTVFTSVDDLPTPNINEVPTKPGLKRTSWASEAPVSKKQEISEVMQVMSTVPSEQAGEYNLKSVSFSKQKKQRKVRDLKMKSHQNNSKKKNKNPKPGKPFKRHGKNK
ncbi:ATP-dependent rRNA helicase RRP3 isoform 1 [Schistosoma japonicum]|uniref:RNA helicase n=1 Tax=Schistosoma japonicum TaxID=6182 RepID=C1L5J7_SCHJA|nr:ATP-dependent rRNA helicase RRP3 [Schistosoma japonicum]KAH8867020.1 ATP-dependent rRNA helicase RRP3 [Schistosoma japonicum]TNN07523.1 ATP-dependent rRNA helicase RRP3 isoform 1 [Schistosoma japonicum]CAX69975.1 ATP-dependent rRNA helicase RRP3 [Schistosoma japonicum]CAX74284.1 ATP-dependent rRNA helicase RRP3 [Schistosoma japonicum]